MSRELLIGRLAFIMVRCLQVITIASVFAGAWDLVLPTLFQWCNNNAGVTYLRNRSVLRSSTQSTIAYTHSYLLPREILSCLPVAADEHFCWQSFLQSSAQANYFLMAVECCQNLHADSMSQCINFGSEICSNVRFTQRTSQTLLCRNHFSWCGWGVVHPQGRRLLRSSRQLRGCWSTTHTARGVSFMCCLAIISHQVGDFLSHRA